MLYEIPSTVTTVDAFWFDYYQSLTRNIQEALMRQWLSGGENAIPDHVFPILAITLELPTIYVTEEQMQEGWYVRMPGFN